MGVRGEDMNFSPLGRKRYPFSFECKNVERLNIWEAIGQCLHNAKKWIPAVVFKKNREEPWIAIPLRDFLHMYSQIENYEQKEPKTWAEYKNEKKSNISSD